MYIYPDHLKSKAVMWLWELKDIGITAVSAIISVLALTQIGLIIPLVITAVYAFLSIQFDDMSILQFIKNAYNFFIGTKQKYEWRLDDE